MRNVTEVSDALASQAERLDVGKLKLAKEAGITYRTLSHVLSGSQDFKVSTLIAVADRLGMELVLMPKDAVRGLTSEPQAPEIKSRVQAALDRINGAT